MKKEEIFIDLRKLSEEDRKDLVIIVRCDKQKIHWKTEHSLLSGDVDKEYPLFGYDKENKGWSEWWVFEETRTEITFSDFKNLFRDYENEMLEAIQEVVADYYNGLPLIEAKVERLEQLIKEVEEKNK